MNQFVSQGLVWIKFHWQFIVASMSVLIALITYWDSRRNRRLSTIPFLEILRQFDTTKEFIGITLTNHSSTLGIIGRITATVGNIEIENKKITYLDDVLMSLKFNGAYRFSLHHLSKESYLGGGNEVWLIKIATQSLKAEEIKNILFELDKIKMVIEYKSIYNEHFKTNIQDKMFENFDSVAKLI